MSLSSMANTRSKKTYKTIEVVNDVEQQQQLLPRCSTGGASFYSNLSNVISGIGMLSVPYALSQGGWLSLALFAMVGAVCFYTGRLIDCCMRAYRSVKSYPESRTSATSPSAPTAGRPSASSHRALPRRHQLPHPRGRQPRQAPPRRGSGAPGMPGAREAAVRVRAAAVVLPTTWLKNLNMLAYVSAVGLVASLALTASLVWAGVAEKGFHMKGSSLLNLSGLPSALSLYFVCFAGHGVFPTVYTSMKKKRDFPKVLLIFSVLCSLNYALTAVLGYLIYGEDVQAQVTLNLPSGKLYTRIAILTTLITPLAKYPLVIQPVTTALEEKLSMAVATENKGLTRLLTSTAVVVSTVVLACTVPFFGCLMSFIGSSLNVTVAVLFPCLSYLKIYVPRGVHRFEVPAIVGILIIGVCVAVVGTYTSLHQIIGTF